MAALDNGGAVPAELAVRTWATPDRTGRVPAADRARQVVRAALGAAYLEPPTQAKLCASALAALEGLYEHSTDRSRYSILQDLVELLRRWPVDPPLRAIELALRALDIESGRWRYARHYLWKAGLADPRVVIGLIDNLDPARPRRAADAAWAVALVAHQRWRQAAYADLWPRAIEPLSRLSRGEELPVETRRQAIRALGRMPALV